MYRSSKSHGVKIKMTQTFFEVKKFFFEKKETNVKFLFIQKIVK